MKRLAWFLLALVCGISQYAAADTITIEPVADSTVDALMPDLVTNTGNLSASMLGSNNMPATNLKFAYVQYQLPDGLTGQNIASVESVDLQLYRSAASPAASLTYYVYGVFEGFDGESADTYTWNSGVGLDPTHKDVKFLNPGNEDIFYYADAAEAGFVGFIDTASEGPPLRPFGFYPVQAGFATENLKNLFLDDTDGRITFYFKSRAPFGLSTSQTFASIEHPTIAAPTLILNFTPGSQPIPGDYDGSGFVDALDLDVWETQFGQTGTDLTADGDRNELVDGKDFLLWQSNFNPAPGIASVPEPSAFSLALLSLAVPAAGWRRTRVA